jgi:putative DNA primase/helicase
MTEKLQKCNPPIVLQSTEIDFQAAIRDEFINKSAIDPSLFECIAEFASDLAIQNGEVVGEPIAEFLNWKIKDSQNGFSNRPTTFALLLRNEDGTPWQAKLNYQSWNPEKSRYGKAYKAPKLPEGEFSPAYLPPIAPAIRQAIGEFQGVEFPSEGSFWDFVEAHSEIDIVLGEGGKKSLCALSHGVVTIALYGCDAGSKKIDGEHTLIPDLARFCQPGRTFILAFDKDQNPETITRVQAAESRLSWLLRKQAKGITVKVANWETSQGKGLDDLVVNCGPEALHAAIAEASAYRREPKEGDLWYEKETGARALKAVSEIALILKEHWELSYDPYTQNLYHYGLESHGLWSACEDTEIKKLIQGALQETGLPHAPSKVNSIFEYLKVELSDREWKKTAPKKLLPLRNGVFDINTKTLHPHSPEHRFTSQLPHEYNPLATCEPITEWISQTQNGDPQRVQLLRAYLKAGVIGAASLQRFLELIGPGGAGKSTYANLMIALIGRENCYVTSIEELEQNRFATASIYGKRLVYIVDADGYNKTLSKFKALTGQDVLPFERKNKDSKTGFTYQGMVIYVANTPLASSDNTSGLERRRLTVPFSNQIPLGKQRPLIEFDDDGSVSGDFVPYLPGLLNWALEMSDAEMFELVKNTAVSVPSLSAAKIDVLTASNSLAAWLEDCCIFAPGSRSQIGTASKIQVTREVAGGDRITKTEYQNQDIWLYASYRAYCERTGHSKPVTMRKFSDSLVDLCRNQLKNPEVEKQHDRNGAAIVGITLRQEGDTTSPAPIGGGTTSQPEETPDEVWEAIDDEIKPEVKTMVEEVWAYARLQDDRQFAQSFSTWVQNHQSTQARAAAWKYIAATPNGKAIEQRVKSICPTAA